MKLVKPPTDKQITVETVSGKIINILNPDPELFDINDIAHALSHINRFTGHTIKPYSVAEHSVAVSDLCPDKCALAGLLHDASEAYLNDVSSPLKSLLPEYSVIERMFQQRLNMKFVGLISPESHDLVTHYDKIQLLTEAQTLLPSRGEGPEWKSIRDKHKGEYGIVPVCLAPRIAKARFLARYKELTLIKNQAA